MTALPAKSMSRRSAGARSEPPEQPQYLEQPAPAAKSSQATCFSELPLLMTVNDFMQHFSIGRTSFYREVNSGRLKAVKFGTATRICRTEAEAWLVNLPSISVPSSPVGQSAKHDARGQSKGSRRS